MILLVTLAAHLSAFGKTRAGIAASSAIADQARIDAIRLFEHRAMGGHAWNYKAMGYSHPLWPHREVAHIEPLRMSLVFINVVST